MGPTPSSELWRPLPGPQTAAYYSAADELFYGGAAGGGKTDLVLGLALTAHKRSIIFRREFTQLREMIDRSKELVGDGGSFNENLHVWRDLPNGRMLEFGGVKTPLDVNKYKGRAHDLRAFDELPDFNETQYRFLWGWARTATPDQRVRVVATGNPPTTTDGEWVIRRWEAWLDPQYPYPAEPGDLRWYAIVDNKEVEREDGSPFEHGDEIIFPSSRTFIPARLEDNPYLEKTGYRGQMQGLPEPLRSQLLYGNFQAAVGQDPWQLIPTVWVEAAMARWIETPPDVPITAVGIDIARGGQDQTAIARRHGIWFGPIRKFDGRDTPDGQSVVTLLHEEIISDAELFVDAIGVGSAVYDLVRGLGRPIVPVIFSERSTGTDKTGYMGFRNMRAELYWKMREALDPEIGHDIALPPDRELRADLCAPRWQMTPSGILIESKEDIRERLGRSPDAGDAVVMTMATALQPLRGTMPPLTKPSAWRAGSDTSWSVRPSRRRSPYG